MPTVQEQYKLKMGNLEKKYRQKLDQSSTKLTHFELKNEYLKRELCNAVKHIKYLLEVIKLKKEK